ncbi:hypothetical protein RD1_2219 [Roseobacter denitrificans OCh 114]|uniref:Uncharacterized protein n=1 Tax=Roseobacter denitrificans (strain ATCC 33942 / OCh 114) TaxID=375451 RepID=Q167N2_ROSDO|nr:hypothetical protein RD1_2219 [Roseobacter denitrificans OCh 114]
MLSDASPWVYGNPASDAPSSGAGRSVQSAFARASRGIAPVAFGLALRFERCEFFKLFFCRLGLFSRQCRGAFCRLCGIAFGICRLLRRKGLLRLAQFFRFGLAFCRAGERSFVPLCPLCQPVRIACGCLEPLQQVLFRFGCIFQASVKAIAIGILHSVSAHLLAVQGVFALPQVT